MHEDFISYLFAAVRFRTGRARTGRELCGRAAVENGSLFFWPPTEEKSGRNKTIFTCRRGALWASAPPARGII
jgi:hypothetical protein